MPRTRAHAHTYAVLVIRLTHTAHSSVWRRCVRSQRYPHGERSVRHTVCTLSNKFGTRLATGRANTRRANTKHFFERRVTLELAAVYGRTQLRWLTALEPCRALGLNNPCYGKRAILLLLFPSLASSPTFARRYCAISTTLPPPLSSSVVQNPSTSSPGRLGTHPAQPTSSFA